MTSLQYPDDEMKKELEKLKKEHHFTEPNRGNLDDPTIVWRYKKPDYTKANLEFFKGKTMNHQYGSLENIVEDLVKTWEMEATHKTKFSQWTTIDLSPECVYKISGNGGTAYSGEQSKENGNYNNLLENCSKDLYDNTKETFESSHDLFKNTFTSGFAWELVKVYAGPPKVAFSWRHWGRMIGDYKNNKGTSEIVEMYGFGVVQVNANLKIQSIEVYFDANEFLEVLEGKKDHTIVKNGRSMVGSGCPWIEHNKK
jgi:hypothetical protein